jgi:chromosome segregation ATPase
MAQGGCERDADAGDKQVQQAMAEGAAKREPGVNNAPSVPEGYKRAAGITNASPAARVQANMQLAESERERALALMGEADRMSAELTSFVAATNRQVARIQSNNTIIAGLKARDPGAVMQAIQKEQAAAQGAEKPVWVEHETGPIQAQKGLDEQAKQLQEQIAQLEGQSKDLTGQRDKLVGDAERLQQQSDQAQGKEASDLYSQSVAARKQAADVGVQIDAVEAKLLPLRQDLERVQADQKLVAQTIEAFGTQMQSTQANWKKVEGEIANLQKLNEQILNGGGAGGAATAPARPAGQNPQAGTVESGGAAEAGGGAGLGTGVGPMADSVAGKLRQIADLSQQIEARRTEAEQLLKDAMDHVDKAGSAAQQLVSSINSQMSSAGGSQRPEAQAWKRMVELHNPSRFKLRHASLQILLADVYRARAADLAARANTAKVLAAALQPAGLSAPQEAGGPSLQNDADAARTAAVNAYNEAEKELGDVITGPRSNDLANEEVKAAHLMQLVRLYAQAQADPQLASNLAAQARALAAQGEQVQLPTAALPPVIAAALGLNAPPATQPGRGATTQPASATTPGATTPGATTPGATTPETPTPGATTPGAATPEPTTPGATPGAQPAPAGGTPAPSPAPAPGQ